MNIKKTLGTKRLESPDPEIHCGRISVKKAAIDFSWIRWITPKHVSIVVRELDNFIKKPADQLDSPVRHHIDGINAPETNQATIHKKRGPV